MTPSSLTVRAGRWCFRYRNAAFPAAFLLALLLLRPQVLFGRPSVDRIAVIAGGLLALAGEGIRLLTIGYDYIDRGGKRKQVSASRLVTGGVYAHTRNPMYLGNVLLAAGLCLVSGAPAATLVVLPLFAWIYQAIMAAEEEFLHHRFGADYVAYCSRVPRLIPSWRGLRKTLGSGRYHWRRALRKDLSTLAGLSAGLIWLPVWRSFFLEGRAAAQARLPGAAAGTAVVACVYATLAYMKKRRLLLYLPGDLPPAAQPGVR